MRAFAAGCFHFGYRADSLPARHEPAEYVRMLRETLARLPAASDIEVSYAAAFSGSGDMPDPITELADGGFFPPLVHLRVEFQLFIPERLHEQLFPEEPNAVSVGTEQFRIIIRHAYFGPVAFVECVGASEDCTPSDAVRLVRVYLTDQLKGLGAGLLQFEFMGPSPFHANMFLHEADLPETEIQFEDQKLPGYDELVFTSSKADDQDEVLSHIESVLGDELALFYDLQRQAVSLMREGDELVGRWQEAEESSKVQRSRFNLMARLRMHGQAQRLIGDAHTFEARFSIEQSNLDRKLDSIYGKGTITYLERFLRARSESLPHYPVKQLRAWAEHMESLGFKQAELVAIVSSALGGGVVGSLITALLAK